MVKLPLYLLFLISFSMQVHTQIMLEPVWSTAFAGKNAVFMPDGKQIITVGGAGATAWNTETGKEHFTLLGHENPIDTVIISKSGARILTLSKYDSVVKLWDGNNGKHIQSIHYSEKAILGAAISNNDMYLALGCSDGTVTIWNMDSKMEESVFSEHFNKVTAVTFSTTGDTLISGSSMVVLVWDRKTKKVLRTLDVSGGKVESVLINNKGDRLIAACSNGETSVWDVGSGFLEYRIPHNGCRYNNMVLNNKGDKLLLLMDCHTYLIDLYTGEQINGFQNTTFAEKTEQRYGSFSSSGSMFSETMGDSVIRIWDVETNKIIKEIKAHQKYFRTAFFSSSENKIVTTDNSDIVELWDVGSLKKIHSFYGNSIGVLSFDINADKKIMVTGGVLETSAANVKIWDLDSAKVKNNMQYKNSYPTEVYVNAKGEKVIVNIYTIGGGTYMNRSVDIWGVKEKKLLKKVKSTFDVTSGGFNVSGTRFTTYIMPTVVEIWDADNLEIMLRTQATAAGIRPLFMENDDVIAEYNLLYFGRFDGNSGDMVVSMKEYGKGLLHGFSEQYIAIWRNGTDTISVCNQIDGSVTARLIYDKMKHYSLDAAFSRNGKYCIYTESDTSAILWNLETNSLQYRVKGNSKGIVGLFFTKDDTRFITYGADSLIRIWSVKSGELIAMLSAKTNFVTDVKSDDTFSVVVARLRDGTMKKWDVAQVPTEAEENLQMNHGFTLQLSPNPVYENLNIHIDKKIYQPIHYTITNIFGQEMMRNTVINVENTIRVQVYNLISGMYILTAQINGKRIQEKFVVMR